MFSKVPNNPCITHNEIYFLTDTAVWFLFSTAPDCWLLLSLSRSSFSVKLFSIFQHQYGLLLPRVVLSQMQDAVFMFVIDHKVSLSCFLQPVRILLNYCWTLEHIEWILVPLLSSAGFLRVFPLSQVVNKDIRQYCPQYQVPRSSISNQSPVSLGLELVLISVLKGTCWSVSVTPTLFMKQNPDPINFIVCGTHCS